jgi:hypothetical protein
MLPVIHQDVLIVLVALVVVQLVKAGLEVAVAAVVLVPVATVLVVLAVVVAGLVTVAISQRANHTAHLQLHVEEQEDQETHLVKKENLSQNGN